MQINTTKKSLAITITFSAIVFVITIFLTQTFTVFAKETVKTKPEKSHDIFIEMRELITDFNKYIDKEEENKSCYKIYGKNIIFNYNSRKTPKNNLIYSQEGEIASKTYKDNVDDIDNEIFKAVKKLSTNNHVCHLSNFTIASKKLTTIFAMRNSLLEKSQADKSKNNKNIKENDKTDPAFFTFEKTIQQFKDFQAKIDLIKKAAKELKDGEISPEYDVRLTKEERKEINDRAKERAQSYADDFIQAGQEYLYLDIFRSSTTIKSNLGSLSDGNSYFDNYTNTLDFNNIIKDMLSPAAKKQVTEKATEQVKNNNKFRTHFLENQPVINKLIVDDNKNYEANLTKMMELDKYISSYDTPFSNAVVDSLIPFHTTLQETEKLLNYQTENLKYVLNRQNVEVE